MRRTPGKFIVLRHSIQKRVRAKLKEIKRELRRRMHASIPDLGKWLRAVLRGHYNYYGVPQNGRAMNAFRYHVGRLWFRTLRRRSQKTRINWERMERIIKKWLPYHKSNIPIQSNACASLPEAKAQCGSPARWDLSGGRRVTGVPTGIHCDSDSRVSGGALPPSAAVKRR